MSYLLNSFFLSDGLINWLVFSLFYSSPTGKDKMLQLYHLKLFLGWDGPYELILFIQGCLGITPSHFHGVYILLFSLFFIPLVFYIIKQLLSAGFLIQNPFQLNPLIVP